MNAALRIGSFLLWIAYASLLAAEPVAEYQLKAAFLHRFAQFVEWPADRAATTPIVIGVVGTDPFGPYLDDLVAGDQLGTHPFEIRRYRQPADVDACDILFVSRSELLRLKEILAHIDHRPTLTVSDIEDFARHGGVIELATERNRVVLKINVEAAKSANLTLSSKLLRSAQVVSAEGA
jgi:hypothetical protein